MCWKGTKIADGYIQTLDDYLIHELMAAEDQLGAKMTFMQTMPLAAWVIINNNSPSLTLLTT